MFAWIVTRRLARPGAAVMLAAAVVGCEELATAGPSAGPAAASILSRWSPAKSVDPDGANGFNTPAVEGCPNESPDGRQLFIASTRLGGHGGIDIWVARRNGPDEAWGEPENLPAPVNTQWDDFCPTALPADGLLFVSRRPGGCGAGSADIYQTTLHRTAGRTASTWGVTSTARATSSRRRTSQWAAGCSTSRATGTGRTTSS